MIDYFEYKGYHGSVESSIQDGVLFGSVQFIVDLVTYEAETLPDLERAFQSAVDDYLETCKELGKEPDKAFSGTFNVRVGNELHRAAAIAAKLEGLTLNQFVTRALNQATREANEIVHKHYHEH